MSDIGGIIQDDDFAALPDADRRDFLRERDPEFQGVSDLELDAFIDQRLPPTARRALGQPIDDYDPREGNEAAKALVGQLRETPLVDAALGGPMLELPSLPEQRSPGDVGLDAIAKARPLPELEPEGEPGGISEEFLEYMRQVEAGDARGPFREGPAPEAGGRQIGYGHTPQPGEPSEISGEQADALLRDDVAKHEQQARSEIGEEQWGKLSKRDQEKLIDFSFNLGPGFSDEFPKFVDAVLSGDETAQRREYQRFYTDDEGRELPLTDRNRRFFDRYYGAHGQLEARADRVRQRQKPYEGAPEMEYQKKVDEVWNSFVTGGIGSVGAAEWTASNAAMILDRLAEAVGSITGTDENPIFTGGGFGKLEEKYRERAEEMWRLADERRPKDQGLPGKIAEAVGAIPLGVLQAILAAKVAGPIVGFGMLSALGVADQDAWTISKEGAKGSIIGAIFRFMGPVNRPATAAALGGATYAMSEQEGVDRWIETGEMGAFGLIQKPTPRRPKPGIVQRPRIAERPGREIGEELPERPPERPEVPREPEIPDEPPPRERPRPPIEEPRAEPPGEEIGAPEPPGRVAAPEGLPPDWNRADAVAFGRQLGMDQKSAESFADKVETEYREGRLEERATRSREEPVPEVPEEPPARPAPEPEVRADYGRETEIGLANGDTLPGRYALMELADIRSSHDAITFSPVEGYPAGMNERAYHRERSEQDKVIRNADAFKADEIYNDAPNALTGPPIVDSQGLVYGGNGRAMILKRVYNGLSRTPPDEVRVETLAHVERFGLDYNRALNDFVQPVIVRVVDRPLDLNSQGILARRLNETLTQEVSAGDRGVSHGRSISDATMGDFTGMLTKLGDEQTLRAVLSNNRKIVQSLERDGIITKQNRNRYVTENGVLTEDGLRMTENALVGRIIQNAETLNGMGNSLKQKLIRAVPTVLRVEHVAPEMKFRAMVEEAVRQEGHRSANHLTMQDAMNQSSMLEGAISPQIGDLMRVFQGSPLQVKRAFARYGRGIEDFSNQQGSLLEGPPTPEAAWKAAFSAEARKDVGIKEFRGTRSREVRLSDERPKEGTIGAEEVEPGANWVPLTDTVAKPAEARIPKRLQRRSQILQRLVNELKLPIQQGRIRLHGHRFTQSVGGIYVPEPHPGSGTLAIRRWGDVQVAAHEIGHALADRHRVFRAFGEEQSKDHILGDASKDKAVARTQEQMAAELREISYDNTDTAEGYAEGVRVWLTQTPALESRAPLFTPAFELALDTLPKNQKNAFYRARDELHKYFAQPAEESLLGKIGPEKTDLRAAYDSAWDSKRQAAIDDLHGARMLDELIDGRVMPMKAYEKMRRLRRVPAIAHRMLHDGYPVWEAQGKGIGFAGEGILDILAPEARSTRQLEQFWSYALARMATQLQTQVTTKTGRVAKIGNIVPEVMDRLNSLAGKIDNAEAKLERAVRELEVATEPQEISTWKSAVTRLEKTIEKLTDQYDHVFRNAPKVTVKSGPRRENLFSEAEIKAGMKNETPQRRETFDKLKEFNDKVADFAQRAGLFSEQQRQNWLFTDRAFGLFREIERDKRGIGGRADPWSTGSGVQTLRGSSRNVRDPLMNIIEGPARLMQLALENDARRAVARQLDKTGGGAFGAKIPESAEHQRISVGQLIAGLKRELDQLGIPFPKPVLEIKGMADAVTLWMGKKKPYGDHIMTYLENGKPVYYDLFDPILTKSVASMRRPEPIIRWANEARKWIQDFRVMTPGFMGANMTRDPVMATITTRTGKQALTSTIRAYFHQMRGSPEWREYLQNGGGGATIRRDPAFRRRMLTRHAQRKGFDPRALIVGPRDVWYAMESLGRAIENAPRFGEYLRAREKGASKGHSAFLASEVSTDFSVKGGAHTYRFLAETIPFFNAMVQGADKITRSVPGGMLGVKDGTRKYRALAGVKMGTVALYSMGLAAINWGIEEYVDLPDWDKWAYWHYYIPWGRDPKTGKQLYKHFKQPKIWEVGMIGTLAEQLVRPDNPTWGEYGKDAMGIVANNFFLGMPVGISQLYEQGANKVWFTGQPIETKGMQRRQRGTRYHPGTSASLRELGKATDVSPVRMEALFRSIFGEFAMWGLHAMDMSLGFEPRNMRLDEMPLVKRFYERPGKYSRYVGDFYDLLNDIDQVWNSYMQMEKEGDYDRADELLSDPRINYQKHMGKASRYVSELNAEMNRLKLDREMPREQREAMIEELRLERNRFMKETVQDVEGELRGD